MMYHQIPRVLLQIKKKGSRKKKQRKRERQGERHTDGVPSDKMGAAAELKERRKKNKSRERQTQLHTYTHTHTQMMHHQTPKKKKG